MSYTFDERDEFSRKLIAQKVIKLLKSKIQISPLVIDGNWGVGKTEFCQKLIELIKEEDTYTAIYIDAFKADHSDEPLLTVIAKVIENLPDDDQKTKLAKKAIPSLKYGLKVLGKAVVSHALREDTESLVEGYDKEIQKVSDKVIDASINSILKDHVDADKNLRSLQNCLKEIADSKQIVLFIDELDRCRPDYAIQMLETIKHTFDVEGVQFVLVTNTEQLRASIENCYGPKIDAQKYLDKFLGFTFTLPESFNFGLNNVHASARHYQTCLEKSSILSTTGKYNLPHMRSLIEDVIKVNNLSLREVETFVCFIEIYETISDEEYSLLSSSDVLLFIKIVGIFFVSLRPNLAKDVLAENLDASKLGAFLGVNEMPTFIGENEIHSNTSAEFVAVMLGRECPINSDLFRMDGARWTSRIYCSAGSQKEGYALIKLTQTIKLLNLNS